MIFHGKIKELGFRPSNQREWLLFLEQNNGREVDINVTFTTRQRTGKQNNALWLWLTQFADGLNQAGLGMRKVLKESAMIEWNKDTLHDFVFIPMLKALTGKDSTTKMDKTGDIGKVFDTLNVHFSEKFGFQIPPWPEKKKDDEKIEYPVNNLKPTF